MKRSKKSKWAPPISDEKLRSFVDFMNGGSKEAEQLKDEMQRTVDEHKRSWIEEYKFNKRLYDDVFGGDIEDDEDYDNVSY